MTTIKSASQKFLALKHYTLFVTFLCYIPHIFTQPGWLLMIFVAAMGYRLIADHFNLPPVSMWLRLVIVLGCLFLLNEDVRSSGFVVRFLLTFIILKCLEFQTVRDLKVFILCNFFLIFSTLLVIQEIWIIIYLFIAILANLSIMLKLHAPEVSLRHISGKSSQQLLLAIPLVVLLFYFFPRIDPLWKVPSLSKGSTGFNEKMVVGSVAELFHDDNVVMQITFKDKPILNGYWRGIVLNSYTGESWHPSSYNDSSFSPLEPFKANEEGDYEVLLEPKQNKWLFYTGYPRYAEPNLLFSSNHGLIRSNKEVIVQRFLYSIKITPEPYHVLNPSQYIEATGLPEHLNPLLKAWAKENFEKTGRNIQAFITFLHHYINQQPFWYTLTPPVLRYDRNQMDSFWFNTQKGYCEHYASAVTFILRAAGIPARVLLGYQGGGWNPFTHAITIQQSNAHAWVEYWQEGVGWKQLDPTTFIARERIDPAIRNRQAISLNPEDYLNLSELPWQEKMKYFLESVRFYSQRWFLFYNQNTQQNLLQNIGLAHWDKVKLLQASVGAMILFFIIIGLFYQWRQKKTLDKLSVEYHLLQKQFRRFNISTHPSATLKQQCNSLIQKIPSLASFISSFVESYEQLRLKEAKHDPKENWKETIVLFKMLRYELRKQRR